MATNEVDSLRTLDNAVAVLRLALLGSELIESADLVAEDTAQLNVAGHLPDHPDVRFTVKIEVS